MDTLQIQVTSIITSDPYIREKNKRDFFEEYDRIYPFTTESLTSYIKDVDNKEILCIGSSGDHAIESYYQGASSVDTFDINKLTNYYQELKLIALQMLEYDEFFDFFSNRRLKDGKVSISILNKLRDRLSKDTYDLFYYIIDYYGFNCGLLANRLFYEKPIQVDMQERTSYPDADKYYDVQKKLQDKEIRFINCGLKELARRLDKLYDVIYLSNVTSYLLNIEDTVNYIKGLLDHLYENGKLYFAYFYGDDKQQLHPLYDTLGDIHKEEIKSIYGADYKDSIYHIQK